MNDTTRLNKYIAHSTGTSRREADNLIAAGRVKIGETVAVVGSQVNGKDIVTIDGRPINQQTAYQYFRLHKPTGYVCSRRRQGDVPTIYELLPSNLHHLKAVGRLDKDSSGLLIMTDDGDMAHSMTHPSFHKTKTYHIALDHDLAPLHRQMISDHGISLEDGVSQLQLERINDGDELQWIVSMHEGRNRQIRRTFDALGYTVTRLHRTQFGPYQLEGLEAGKFKEFETL